MSMPVGNPSESPQEFPQSLKVHDKEIHSQDQVCKKNARRPGAPGLWLDTDSGLLRLPLSANGEVPRVGGLVVSSLGGGGRDDAAWDTLGAARWLMPSLSAELISEVLGLSSATDTCQ